MNRLLCHLLLLASLAGQGSGEQSISFLKLETGVSGGIAFHRDTALLVIPDGSGRAEVWLEDHGRYRRGQVADYEELMRQLEEVHRLSDYQFHLDHADFYGQGVSLHVHDSRRCFNYSPPRGCDRSPDNSPAPSQPEKDRFRQVCAQLRGVEAEATQQATEEQFRAAEASIQ